jgi:hypothetical protein
MRLHPQLNLSVENNYLLPRIVVFFLGYVKETFLVSIKSLSGTNHKNDPMVHKG